MKLTKPAEQEMNSVIAYQSELHATNGDCNCGTDNHANMGNVGAGAVSAILSAVGCGVIKDTWDYIFN